MNKYMQSFMKLRCAGDVLNSMPRLSNAEKEITESMAVIKHLKQIVLPDPMKYSVIDMCAGNALTSVIAVHMLPVLCATAIDKKKRHGDYDRVKRFEYIEGDIKDCGKIDSNDIIIAVHPCKTAIDIVDMFNQSDAKALIMVPCCKGETYLSGKSWLKDKLGSYNSWTYYLALELSSTESCWWNIYTDNDILSPCNNVIVAVR